MNKGVQGHRSAKQDTKHQVLSHNATDGKSNFSTIGVALAFLAVAGVMGLFKQENRSACMAEFLGTFMLVFSVGCNVLVGDATWGVTSIACTLMVMIYSLGAVS